MSVGQALGLPFDSTSSILGWERHLHLTARGAWCNIGVSVQGTQEKGTKGDRHLPSYPGIGCF